MYLIIIRHGKAHQHAPDGSDDARELKSRGRHQARWLGGQLAGAEFCPTRLISSPVTRALQTAECINESLELDLVVDPRLSTRCGASDVVDLIGEHRDAAALATVGHNPTCETLVATLLRGPAAHADPHRTGEAFVLRVDGGGCELITTLRADD